MEGFVPGKQSLGVESFCDKMGEVLTLRVNCYADLENTFMGSTNIQAVAQYLKFLNISLRNCWTVLIMIA